MAVGDIMFSGNMPIRAICQDMDGATDWWALFQTPGSLRFYVGSSVGNGDAPSICPLLLNQSYNVTLYEGSSAPVPGALFQYELTVDSVTINRVGNPVLSTTSLRHTGNLANILTPVIPPELGAASLVGDLAVQPGVVYTLVVSPAA